MSFEIPLTEKVRIVFSYFRFVLTQRSLRTNEKVIVDTTYGKIKGCKWLTLYGHDEYYSFEGIPFAQPPLGDLRFKAPIEPRPWRGYRLCTHTRDKPYQYDIFMKQMQGSEDCLYLNVYTKELKPTKPWPVLVWFHGGGFQIGETCREFYSPDYMMMENVVLLTVAYRVGPLGFLSLSDRDCEIPGNAGLKDQILALKWVKNNCHFFGGDPDNITLFGESAGASSIQYLMVSEQAKNLFHKAIVMSGSILSPWACVPNLNWAYKLAKATGYKGANTDKDVLQHLKKLKPASMYKATHNLLTRDEVQRQGILMCFVPCVEPYETEHCVINRNLLEMLRNNWSNNIPLLIGANSFEGLLSFIEVQRFPYLLNDYRVDYMPPLDANLTPEKRLQYGRKIKEMYFGDKEPSWDTVLNYCDITSYRNSWHGIHRTLLARRQYATAATFLYRFDFDSRDFNTPRNILCGRKVRGTSHGDEVPYIFYNARAYKLERNSAEYKTIRRMVTMIMKFATYGNPSLNSRVGDINEKEHTKMLVNAEDDTVHEYSECDRHEKIKIDRNNDNDLQHEFWPPITYYDDATPFKCLNISDEIEVIDLPEAEKLKFWDSMYEDKNMLY